MLRRFILPGILLMNFGVTEGIGDTGSSLADRISPPAGRFEVKGHGFVTDASHPKRPGDVRREAVTFRFLIDPAAGNAIFEFVSGEADKLVTDRYFVRRGAPFQQSDTNQEIRATSFGDLSAATITALHPALVASALSRRENVHSLPGKQALLLSWNESLWQVQIDAATSRILGLRRQLHHPVHGDRVEQIRYESWRTSLTTKLPHRVVVTESDREVANLEITSIMPLSTRIVLPAEKDESQLPLLDSEDITFREVAPNLFAIDLVPANSRVFVAEFADHVVVLEGAYSSRNGDLLARLISQRFDKPIRYFAFSHIHGQYIGGVRSYVHAGATVLVPPATLPLVSEVVAARHDLRPDALSRNPKKLRTGAVDRKTVLQDEMNTLEMFNVDSDHTDEYLIFYFPRQKTLLTADLLFYRGPDQPLRGRSLKLCSTIKALGIDAQTMYVSWPLEGYGVRNTVTGEEFRAACEAGAARAK